MPLLHRTNPSGEAPAMRVSRMDHLWPGAIALTAVIVFLVFLVLTSLVIALLLAMATLVVGGLLLTLMAGTDWISQLRRLLTQPRRHR